MAGWSLIRIRCNYFWYCSIGIPIVYFIGSHIFTEKMLFWREKFKPHQFHYIAIEVKIGPRWLALGESYGPHFWCGILGYP